MIEWVCKDFCNKLVGFCGFLALNVMDLDGFDGVMFGRCMEGIGAEKIVRKHFEGVYLHNVYI